MSTVNSTPAHWATQTASWSESYNDETYTASVYRDGATDDAGRTGWSYSLQLSRPGVGFHHTFARPGELLWSHDSDPLDVLATLASFVGAWDEAVNYGVPTYGSSENADLFPASVADWLYASDDFTMWGYDHENADDDETAS